MMEYLIISQDEEENEKYGLRPGVGLAAPQVGISQQFSSILIPDEDVDDSDIDEDAEPTYFFRQSTTVITRQSVKQTALSMGEGCLSVDEDVPGYVERSYRITVKYQDENGDFQELKLEGYPAIVYPVKIDRPTVRTTITSARRRHGQNLTAHVTLGSPDGQWR